MVISRFSWAESWQLFALLSALFAALTAIFGKLGVAGLNSNLATLIRTVVILFLTSGIVFWRGEWRWPAGAGSAGGVTSVLFLILSGVATGLSWLCYYRALQLGPASRVAPVDKLSVVLVILLAAIFLGEQITWRVASGGFLILAGAALMAL